MSRATETVMTAWGFILPVLLGLVVLTYGPTVVSFALSFTEWDLLGTPQWVGLANYQALLLDPYFWKVLGNTTVFVTTVTTGEVLLAIALAWWVFRLVGCWAWLQHTCRTAFFLPVVAPLVSVALVWGWLYDPDIGLANGLLAASGSLAWLNHGEPIAWLADPKTALWAVIVLQVWKSAGYAFVILLAALHALDDSLLEAATLDGAKPLQQLWRVVLPAIAPTVFFVVVMGVINNFQAFDSIYLLTHGGPNSATEVVVHWLFTQAFQGFKVGKASALAYLLFLVIAGLTGLQWWVKARLAADTEN